jgi:hypothetical protein
MPDDVGVRRDRVLATLILRVIGYVGLMLLRAGHRRTMTPISSVSCDSSPASMLRAASVAPGRQSAVSSATGCRSDTERARPVFFWPQALATPRSLHQRRPALEIDILPQGRSGRWD